MDERRTGIMPRVTCAHTVAEAIRLLRLRAGLERDEVAARSEVSSGTVSNYETGKTQRPGANELWRILGVLADALDVSRDKVWSEVMEISEVEARAAALDAEAGMLRDEPEEG
jgi:transcriptional regulator with XRE-family HTH domain